MTDAPHMHRRHPRAGGDPVRRSLLGRPQLWYDVESEEHRAFRGNELTAKGLVRALSGPGQLPIAAEYRIAAFAKGFAEVRAAWRKRPMIFGVIPEARRAVGDPLEDQQIPRPAVRLMDPGSEAGAGSATRFRGDDG